MANIEATTGGKFIVNVYTEADVQRAFLRRAASELGLILEFLPGFQRLTGPSYQLGNLLNELDRVGVPLI